MTQLIRHFSTKLSLHNKKPENRSGQHSRETTKELVCFHHPEQPAEQLELKTRVAIFQSIILWCRIILILSTPSTTIQFALPKEGRVSIKIFNMLGKHIAHLLMSFSMRDIMKWPLIWTPSQAEYISIRWEQDLSLRLKKWCWWNNFKDSHYNACYLSDQR